jgi:hypothetical protein
MKRRAQHEEREMFRKVLIGTLLALAVVSTAQAQSPKVDVSLLFGYTLSDGVSGDARKAADGNTYDRIDPKDSMFYGIAGGVYVTPGFEIGFMWRRQTTTIQISGTTTKDLGEANIDGYHPFFAYHFGDAEAKVRPYILMGIGATTYGGFSYTAPDGSLQNVTGDTQFSTTWGAGVKLYASRNVGFQLGMQWTPTYIKSDPSGYWCGWYGCYLVGDPQYSNQLEFFGGVTFRF